MLAPLLAYRNRPQRFTMLPAERPAAQSSPQPELPVQAKDAAMPLHNTCRTISSTELFQEGREVWIQHGQEIYRLRLTKNGKLILHK